jgi:hypothetical protein
MAGAVEPLLAFGASLPAVLLVAFAWLHPTRNIAAANSFAAQRAWAAGCRNEVVMGSPLFRRPQSAPLAVDAKRRGDFIAWIISIAD